MAEFGKVVLFGAGLIGGSMALALQAADAVEEVVGFGRTPGSLKVAQELGVIDRAGINPAHEIPDADLVVIATPVAQMGDIFTRIAPYLQPDSLVTDAGSIKVGVIATARSALRGKIGRFVPAHPIAGTQFSGPKAADATLFQSRKVVITPLPENRDETLDRVKRAWALCGADIFELDAQQHDRIFAAVSHLPHLLSFALVNELAQREDSALFFEFAASGFRDFTRIAGSHPEMWRDICLANRHALIAELGYYQTALDELTGALASEDGEKLESIFRLARQARRDWANEN